MTSPVALMFMVGLLAVAATGTFINGSKTTRRSHPPGIPQKIPPPPPITARRAGSRPTGQDKIADAAAKVARAAAPLKAQPLRRGGGPLSVPGQRRVPFAVPAAAHPPADPHPRPMALPAQPQGNRPDRRPARPDESTAAPGNSSSRSWVSRIIPQARSHQPARSPQRPAHEEPAALKPGPRPRRGRQRDFTRRGPPQFQQGRNGTRPASPSTPGPTRPRHHDAIPQPYRGSLPRRLPEVTSASPRSTNLVAGLPTGPVTTPGPPLPLPPGRSPRPGDQHEQTG